MPNPTPTTNGATDDDRAETVEPTTEHHDSPDGVATSALDGLAAKLRGALVRPADPEYDSIRAVFNGMIDRRRQAVVQCAGQSDVARGAVNVNDMFANVFAVPIPQGGWKNSGVGARLGGAHGIRKYCRPQAITATRLTPRSELLWYPYTARTGKLGLRLFRLLLARDWRRRLSRRRQPPVSPRDQGQGEDHEESSIRQ